MFKLVIQDDEGKTTVVPLIRDEITIGRKEGNTIRLTERNVSRRHARILRNNGEVQIEDLGSYNGIRVNNARIAERVSLRVSDQVQIGDYKLYLKAEGVEQVDDARTMPIERLENAPATDVMPAVAPTPTAPLPTQTPPTATPAVGQRQLGVADTDPAARPVATAAQIAALSAPVGYGRLVVISSNFAGKEFDLTRPQMIIGRTDENDLVIGHRSISRNHAKITRDPETGRYTISDLQSSNGVRVNGQDYGKVELRRGDTVDLGHVRLRFVEPGEDWLFSRDAVIADVAEGGSNKMLMVAIVLGVLVLAGVAVFFMINRTHEESGTKGSDNGTNGLATGSDHGQIASDNGSNNQGSAGVAMVMPDAAVATVGSNAGSDDEGSQIKIQCLRYQSDHKWTDLDSCAGRYSTYDPAQAKAWKDNAVSELKNQLKLNDIDRALSDKDFHRASKAADEIDGNSVYKISATTKLSEYERGQIDDYRGRALADARAHKCADLERLAGQAGSTISPKVADAVRAVKCEAVVVSAGDHDHGTHTGSAAVVAPPPSCDADELKANGGNAQSVGQHNTAEKEYEAAFKCKPDAHTAQLVFMEACNAKMLDKARSFYKKLSPDAQNKFVVMCIRNGITKDQLDAP